MGQILSSRDIYYQPRLQVMMTLIGKRGSCSGGRCHTQRDPLSGSVWQSMTSLSKQSTAALLQTLQSLKGGYQTWRRVFARSRLSTSFIMPLQPCSPQLCFSPKKFPCKSYFLTFNLQMTQKSFPITKNLPIVAFIPENRDLAFRCLHCLDEVPVIKISRASWALMDWKP